jgi:putative ABC transport system substrate-binding protein
MRLRSVLATIALGLLVALRVPEAQPPGKVHQIGILVPGFAPISRSPLQEVLRQGLRELGEVEGQNVSMAWRWAEGRYTRLPGLAAELVRRKVDVILSISTPAIRAAKQATATTPIVMVFSDDPVGTGLIASLARPGGNITGLSFLSSELSGKRLELLKEAVPTAARVGILWNAANPSAALQVRETEVAARALGVEVQSWAVREPAEFEGAFAAMTRAQIGGLVVVDDPLLVDYHRQLVDLAVRSRLPAMYGMREFVEAGGLMSYGPSVADMLRRAAVFVDKILKGARPADVPVEQPTKFELVLNLKTAQAMGLTMAPIMLFRADEVLE